MEPGRYLQVESYLGVDVSRPVVILCAKVSKATREKVRALRTGEFQSEVPCLNLTPSRWMCISSDLNECSRNTWRLVRNGRARDHLLSNLINPSHAHISIAFVSYVAAKILTMDSCERKQIRIARRISDCFVYRKNWRRDA